MTLSNDTSRCHDQKCEVKQYCERWLQRESGGTYVVHAMTLRLGYECHDEFCQQAIPLGDD
jgi:hypothetical protein